VFGGTYTNKIESFETQLTVHDNQLCQLYLGLDYVSSQKSYLRTGVLCRPYEREYCGHYNYCLTLYS